MEVNKDKFYAGIGKMDVILSIEGNYPYTTRFLTRKDRVEKRRIIDHGTNEPSDYYLTA